MSSVKRRFPPGCFAPRGPLRAASSRPVVSAVLLLGALLLAACGDRPTGSDEMNNGSQGPPPGLAACSSAPPLSEFPVPIDQIDFIGPLGSMAPGGHLFPAGHLGLHPKRGAPGTMVSVPVRAPGPMTVESARSTTFTGGGTTFTDYALFFFPCADVRMHFGHLATLDPTVLNAIGGFAGAECAPPYMIGSTAVTQCSKRIVFRLESGRPVGTINATLDWGAGDRRKPLAFVNPSRMRAPDDAYGQNVVACPVDYLPPAVQASVHGLFGERGGLVRTAEPVCGTVMQDVPGTVQGRWFINDNIDERQHLALVRDYVDPSIGVFSVGTSIPSVPTNLYRFVPAISGRVNLDFPSVRADGSIYCYQSLRYMNASNLVILIQLVTDLRLRIEGFPRADCGSPDTWAFSPAAREFAR